MSLKETRHSVATDLQEAGINAFANTPQRVVPPCVIIENGEPYVEQGETFSQTDFKVNLNVYALVAPATKETMNSNLDDLIESVIFNLGEWQVGGVSVDFWTVGESVFAGARIPITRNFDLGGNN